METFNLETLTADEDVVYMEDHLRKRRRFAKPEVLTNAKGSPRDSRRARIYKKRRA